VIPIMVLEKVETLTGRPTSQLFDMVAGTSTGGVIAMALVTPDEAGRPRWSAHGLLSVFLRRGDDVFPHIRGHLVRAAEGLLEAKYPTTGVDELAAELFGDVALSQALADVVVPAYALERREPLFFKRHKAREDARFDMPMRVIARACTAAPTYFAPAKIRIGDTSDYLALVDGGVFANNPAMSAYVEARRLYPHADISVLSLGTGELTARIPYSEARHWGLAKWARPLLGVTLDGSNHAIDYQLKHLLGPARYTRLQPTLDEGGSKLDDARFENLRELRLVAERQLQHHKDEIAGIAAELDA
jgi:patatin-like phospholipase/acyl hydrolase